MTTANVKIDKLIDKVIIINVDGQAPEEIAKAVKKELEKLTELIEDDEESNSDKS